MFFMDEVIYYKAERFFPDKNYEEFSKIFGRAEIVTYDIMLCRVIHDENLLAEVDLYPGKVKNWKSLLPPGADEQIIAYYKNPTSSYELRVLDEGFEFCGYDLSEEMTGISAVTNCGALFDGAIPYEKINKFGLIDEFYEAFRIRKMLDELYPYESHADCEVYEIWRRLS